MVIEHLYEFCEILEAALEARSLGEPTVKLSELLIVHLKKSRIHLYLYFTLGIISINSKDRHDFYNPCHAPLLNGSPTIKLWPPIRKWHRT